VGASKRVDVHAHYLPDFYREALAAARQSPPDGIPALPEWSESAQLAAMDALGIRTSYLSISSPGVYFGDASEALALALRVNDEAARLMRAHPGRFEFFASVPLPDIDAAESVLSRALAEQHASGLVLLSNSAGIYLGDQRLEGLYAILDQHRATLFIHPTTPYRGEHLALGFPRPMFEFFFDTTRSVIDLIAAGITERYPRMRIIVPHAGAALPILANRADFQLPPWAAAHGRPVHSIASALKSMYFDLAGLPEPQQLGALVSLVDSSRLLYGSDYPFTSVQACANLAELLDNSTTLDDRTLESVYCLNARQLKGT
jgi:6-methylsalicylate decarboxylase